jgi:hypothetical protein
MDKCFVCKTELPAPDPVTGLTVCPGCGNTQNTIYNQGDKVTPQVQG